jgi:hypothetical protein
MKTLPFFKTISNIYLFPEKLFYLKYRKSCRKEKREILKVREGVLNINSLLAGFVGGLLCSTVLFFISRALLIPGMLKAERVKDLSYFGRYPAKAKKKAR